MNAYLYAEPMAPVYASVETMAFILFISWFAVPIITVSIWSLLKKFTNKSRWNHRCIFLGILLQALALGYSFWDITDANPQNPLFSVLLAMGIATLIAMGLALISAIIVKDKRSMSRMIAGLSG